MPFPAINPGQDNTRTLLLNTFINYSAHVARPSSEALKQIQATQISPVAYGKHTGNDEWQIYNKSKLTYRFLEGVPLDHGRLFHGRDISVS